MDEQLARAWHKATGQRIAMMRVYRWADTMAEDGALPPDDPRAGSDYGQPEWCRYDPDVEDPIAHDGRDWRWSTIPEVADEPWEWVKALVGAAMTITIDGTQVYLQALASSSPGVEVDIADDDIEAAFEAAIRKWEERA